jgi:hypothetical protein
MQNSLTHLLVKDKSLSCFRSLVLGGLLTMFATSAAAYIIGPTSPGKWGSPIIGTGATVTYSFMDNGVSCGGESDCATLPGDGLNTSILSGMGAGGVTAITAAFDAWSAVADISFSLVADDGAAYDTATSSGDIRIGMHYFDGSGGTLAHAYFPPNNGFTIAGDMHFDISETWETGFGGIGFDIFTVAAHEIGHAIGLGHTDIDDSLMEPYYSEAFSGLQADDIAGAQYLYGAPVTTPVPEPTTGLLLLTGMFSFMVCVRRKRSAFKNV